MVVSVLKQHCVTHFPITVTTSLFCEENVGGVLSTATSTADNAAPV